jgi:hypothetical protein
MWYGRNHSSPPATLQDKRMPDPTRKTAMISSTSVDFPCRFPLRCGHASLPCQSCYTRSAMEELGIDDTQDKEHQWRLD